MSEPRAEWPELEPCVCGGGHDAWDERTSFGVYCPRLIRSLCNRSVEGRSPQEAGASWNAMQRVAKGKEEAESEV